MRSRVPVCRPSPSPLALGAIAEVLESGWWGYGTKCAELEALYVGEFGGFALACTSCTSALYIAARLLRAHPGDNVIVPAITFVSTAAAFLAAGLSVKCVDVNEETLLMNEDVLSGAIDERTRAIIAVHLYGQRMPLENLRRLTEQRGIVLIEDCAHRQFQPGEHPLGDIACFSFNAVKEIPAGEGGLLWCADKSLRSLAETTSNVGLDLDTINRSRTAVHAHTTFTGHAGLKLRSDDLTAALILAQRPLAATGRARRQRIFEEYEDVLHRYRHVIRSISRHSDDSYLMFVAKCGPGLRPFIQSALARHGVATSSHYPSLGSHPLVLRHGDLHVADATQDMLLTLPCFSGMTKDELGRVVRALRSVLKKVTEEKSRFRE